MPKSISMAPQLPPNHPDRRVLGRAARVCQKRSVIGDDRCPIGGDQRHGFVHDCAPQRGDV